MVSRAMRSAPTEQHMLGLYFIHRYRFLTVRQFAAVTGLKEKSASEVLLRYERRGFLDHFGNVGIRGYGKTPKVYFLKRAGYDLLAEESGIPYELLGDFKKAKVNTRWSPQMYHRLATLDALIALEVGVIARPHIQVAETFIEYRQRKVNQSWRPETSDYVADARTPENRIIPDAGFILENVESGKRALFFLEIDMGTERITSKLGHGQRFSVHHKIRQYDRYLQSGMFQRTYAPWGEFTFFTLLFVTTTETRLDNMRKALSNLPPSLHGYYRFNTLDVVLADFFNGAWRARVIEDENRYRLIREE
ncbi:replication-relaxation family protein [Marimonas sp. MJW-29]|uniref:Replication-relaxation family protein n=1 Tax=Sulfitobacter sediminis TaxID=3234186 RepID=A0ABV3RNZ7_9RHOB